MRALDFVRENGDRLLALALVAALVLETAIAPTGADAESPDPITARAALALASGLALAGSLAWRRRAPLVVLTLAILAAMASVGPPLDATVAVVIAIVVASYTVGAATTGRAATIGAAGVLALVGIAVGRDIDGDQDLADLALPILVVGGPWLAGVALRVRREREVALERARVDEAAAAVADERARIARELHDAIAHAIGIVVLQARGARRTLASDPGAAREALDVIEGTASQTLVEMRRLVGVLRQDTEGVALSPPPSLRHLDGLIERVRAAGLPVSLTIEGTPAELPPGIDLSAYRIVQEALTNALTHAGPATASVLVRYRPDRLDLEIADTGAGLGQARGAGHGLIGMRERVALYDGRLEAADGPGGGFVISASLPLDGRPA